MEGNAVANVQRNLMIVDAMRQVMEKCPDTHIVQFNNSHCWGHPSCEVKPSVKFDYEGGCVILGKHVVIADDVKIRTHAHPDMKYKQNWIGTPTVEHILTIDNEVFIGDRVLITPGCKHIAEGSIIGMGAVLTKDINEPYCIWGGNPAKKIGERE